MGGIDDPCRGGSRCSSPRWLGSICFAGAAGSSSAVTGWWVGTPGFAFTLVLAVLLTGYALWPAMRRWRRRATQLAVLALVVRQLVDVVIVCHVLSTGRVASRYAPLSIALALAGLFMLRGLFRQQREPTWSSRLETCMAAGAFALLFAWGQMLCFGNSDYRRPADAVVVFGARVYADGSPSLALADRVRTAARLVRDGYAPVLVVSGGPGDGATHEVDAMRELAIAEGVSPEAIVVDRDGWTTRATVVNSRQLLGEGDVRVLAVSHSYHLPRIKLSYQQLGIRAYTVPAAETRTLVKLPWFMARESLAFWAHAFQFA